MRCACDLDIMWTNDSPTVFPGGLRFFKDALWTISEWRWKEERRSGRVSRPHLSICQRRTSFNNLTVYMLDLIFLSEKKLEKVDYSNSSCRKNKLEPRQVIRLAQGHTACQHHTPASVRFIPRTALGGSLLPGLRAFFMLFSMK